MADVTFDIKEHLGVLSESSRGWKKELNIVIWNDREPKFDIREWSPDYTKMSKGLTFTADELQELKQILEEMEL
ncbi:YdbC family protein [Atopococcus tabaci]|uniref:YdbC family protein n=1 Tax=Atopococcus tabaci TaxID=269774 RepID=UPI00240947DC|nr:PC4/YdbC family ssDNA-binding protein [Atopococcus tabaci]